MKLWKKIKTFEDKKWTKKYHDPDPNKKSFGGRVVIKMKDGRKIQDEISVADAHPAGSRPFTRFNYIEKFITLTKGIVEMKEAERFLRDVQNLRTLKSGSLSKLNIKVKNRILSKKKGRIAIF